MNKNWFEIEKGTISVEGNEVFSSLYMQIQKGNVTGLIINSAVEQNCILSIFQGQLKLESGNFYINSNKASASQLLDFFQKNVYFISKHESLISALSIEDNVMLLSGSHFFAFSRKIRKRFEALLVQFKLDYSIGDLKQPISTCDRIIFEILKSFIDNKRIIILTGIRGLSQKDLCKVNYLIQQMLQFDISFIAIDTINGNILNLANRLFTIYHGRTRSYSESINLKQQSIFQALAKNTFSIQQLYSKQTAIKLDNVMTKSIMNISFSVDKGELIKLVYLDERTSEGIIDILKGKTSPIFGSIEIDNKIYKPQKISHCVKAGVCFIEETPSNYLFHDLSILDNVAVIMSKKIPFFWLYPGYTKSISEQIRLFMGPIDVNQKLRHLKIEQIQKISYVKWILFSSKVAVCIRPFNETDIKVIRVTFEMIQTMQAKGIAVIIISPNLPELNELKGATLFLKNGKTISQDEFNDSYYIDTDINNSHNKS